VTTHLQETFRSSLLSRGRLSDIEHLVLLLLLLLEV